MGRATLLDLDGGSFGTSVLAPPSFKGDFRRT